VDSKLSRVLRYSLKYIFSNYSPTLSKRFDFAFTETGSAKYYDNEVYPIETNSVAAALILFNELADNGWIKTDEAIEASAVAYKAGIRDLYLGNGEFAYRKWQNTRIDTVFIRWSQVWMLYGLECLICLNEKTK